MKAIQLDLNAPKVREVLRRRLGKNPPHLEIGPEVNGTYYPKYTGENGEDVVVSVDVNELKAEGL